MKERKLLMQQAPPWLNEEGGLQDIEPHIYPYWETVDVATRVLRLSSNADGKTE